MVKKGAVNILTFEDLQDCGDNEQQRAAFVEKLVQDHKSSQAYKTAKENQAYYDGENPRIMRLEKIIYDYMGVAHRDLYSPNHKIPSQMFGNVVDQEVSYLLRNGITWTKAETKGKVGNDFHRRCADVLESAAVQGLSFGFWNHDHMEQFCFADSDTEPGCAPLWGATDGQLHACVRYWQIDTSKPQRMTLYEEDGYTDYIKNKDEEIKLLREKQTYIQNQTIKAETGEVLEVTPGGNYKGFPIVPFRYKKNGKSELQGKRNKLDALDLMVSKMVNNVDEGNLIYWVLTNCGGMDEDDDTAFLQQLYRTHVVHADGSDTSEKDAKADAHSIEAPFAGTDAAIERTEKSLMKDFQAFDEASIVAGNQTATAILAAYVGLDGKTDKNEDNMTDFISEILRLAGIDDEPTYTRNKIINKQEEVQTVLSAAQYTGDEYTTKKVLTILGDADQYDEVQQQKDAEAADRYKHLEDTEDQDLGGDEE